METETKTQATVTTWYNIKQALMSIAVGAAISILTVLFQYAVEWLRNIPAEVPGAVVGMAKYLTSWRLNHHV